MKAKKLYARLMPYNKKKGYLCQNYLYKGIRYTNRWKLVSPQAAKHLEEIFQPHDQEDEIPLFQILEEPEAKEIEAQEMEDQGRKNAPRIKDAEKLPDHKVLNEDELRAVAIAAAEDADEDSEPEPEGDPEPAPSLRSGRVRKG